MKVYKEGNFIIVATDADEVKFAEPAGIVNYLPHSDGNGIDLYANSTSVEHAVRQNLVFSEVTDQAGAPYPDFLAWVHENVGFNPASGGSEAVITDANVSGTYDIDWSAASYWDLTLTGVTTFTESNIPETGKGKTIAIRVIGNFALSLPASWNVSGDYDGSVANQIVVASYGTASHFGKISL